MAKVKEKGQEVEKFVKDGVEYTVLAKRETETEIVYILETKSEVKKVAVPKKVEVKDGNQNQ
jgi:hypothetical protein